MATSKSFLPNLWNSFSAKIWQRVMYVDLQFRNIPRHSLLRKIPFEVNRLNQSIVSRPWNVKWYFCLFGGNKIQRNNSPKPDFWMRIVWYDIFPKYLDHRYFWTRSFSLVSSLQEDSLIWHFFASDLCRPAPCKEDGLLRRSMVHVIPCVTLHQL